MSEMKSLVPNLMVKDVNQTLAYYTEVLGFTLVATVPDQGRLVWGMVKAGGATFMFQEEKSLKKEYPALSKFQQGGGLTFYIHVTDVQALFDSLKLKVTMAGPLIKKPYGATEFAIEDINGYILTFSQNIE